MTKYNSRYWMMGALVLGMLTISGCATYQSKSNANGPYDREAICEKLGRQLKYYDNPSYASKHPISQDKLNEMINRYQANGCDK